MDIFWNNTLQMLFVPLLLGFSFMTVLLFSLDINKPPTANAGPDVVVYLPNRAAELVGSSSYDDHGIVEYEWSRDPKSPAAGVSWNKERRKLQMDVFKICYFNLCRSR